MKIFFPLVEYQPISYIGELGISISKIIDELLTKEHDIIISLPYYKNTDLSNYEFKKILVINTLGYECEILKATKNKLIIYLVKNYEFFSRENIYGCYDDIYRFAFYSKAVVEIIKTIDKIDILHICDWHNSFIPLLLEIEKIKIDAVLNIYDLKFQGLTNKQILSFLNIQEDYYHSGLLEYYDGVNILKAGLILSNTVTFNSKVYFENILKNERKSYGLYGLIQVIESKCFDVNHGIDKIYDPNTDEIIDSKYSNFDLSGKTECKISLQKELSLPVHTEIPLIIIPSRYVNEDEIWLLNSIISYLVRMEIQIIILGNKLADFEKNINELSFRLNCSVISLEDNDENLRKAFSAGDILLDISENFLNDELVKIALKYGLLPIVINESPDIVIDSNKFRIFNFTSDDLINTIKYTINKYYHMDKWNEKVKEVMSYDFSWSKTADKYLEIYSKIINKV